MNASQQSIRLKDIMNLQRDIYSTAHTVGHWRKQMKTQRQIKSGSKQ